MRVCVGGGGGEGGWLGVRPPSHPLVTGLLAIICTFLYLLSFKGSWNSEKIVMESHGKVMEFNLRNSVGTLLDNFFFWGGGGSKG